MKRIILFNFHQHFSVCANHIAIIRAYNPGIPVYGLYGGEAKDWPRAKKLDLDHVVMNPVEDSYWKWLQTDLSIRWWFREFGRKISFDMLHVFQWDVLILEAVNKVFSHVKDGVAITDKQPMGPIYDSWMWVAPVRGRMEWNKLNKEVRKKYKISKRPVAGIFPGACLSRQFLTRYSKEQIAGICNDEVRVPLFAQAYNLPVYDTRLKGEFFYADRTRELMTPSLIYEQYAKGILAFHPFQQKLSLKKLLAIKQSLKV